jgi:membrane protein
MARLGDVRRVYKSIGFMAFCRRVWREVCDDEVFVWASALAYAWLFALFPFMIFVLSLVPHLPEHVKDRALHELHHAINTVLADNAAQMMNDNIESVLTHRRSTLLSLGLIVTVWAASGGMNMTMSALDKCYDVPVGRSILIQRPVALVLTVVVATLIVAVLVLVPVGTLVTHYFERKELPGLTRWVLLMWNVARYSVAVVLLMTLLAIVYHFGPCVRQNYTAITPGSVFTLTVWILLGIAFRIYVNRFGKYDQTYGTVGGVAVLLLFFYIDAVVLLVGAEINSEIDFVLGVPRGSFDFRCRGPVASVKASLVQVLPTNSDEE